MTVADSSFCLLTFEFFAHPYEHFKRGSFAIQECVLGYFFHFDFPISFTVNFQDIKVESPEDINYFYEQLQLLG